MIPKKPVPGLTRDGSRFSEEIMLKQKMHFDPILVGSNAVTRHKRIAARGGCREPQSRA